MVASFPVVTSNHLSSARHYRRKQLRRRQPRYTLYCHMMGYSYRCRHQLPRKQGSCLSILPILLKSITRLLFRINYLANQEIIVRSTERANPTMSRRPAVKPIVVINREYRMYERNNMVSWLLCLIWHILAVRIEINCRILIRGKHAAERWKHAWRSEQEDPVRMEQLEEDVSVLRGGYIRILKEIVTG